MVNIIILNMKVVILGLAGAVVVYFLIYELVKLLRIIFIILNFNKYQWLYFNCIFLIFCIIQINFSFCENDINNNIISSNEMINKGNSNNLLSLTLFIGINGVFIMFCSTGFVGLGIAGYFATILNGYHIATPEEVEVLNQLVDSINNEFGVGLDSSELIERYNIGSIVLYQDLDRHSALWYCIDWLKNGGLIPLVGGLMSIVYNSLSEIQTFFINIYKILFK